MPKVSWDTDVGLLGNQFKNARLYVSEELSWIAHEPAAIFFIFRYLSYTSWAVANLQNVAPGANLKKAAPYVTEHNGGF